MNTDSLDGGDDRPASAPSGAATTDGELPADAGEERPALAVQEDPLAPTRARIKDLHEYDHRALDLYGSFGHYLALRIEGVPQAQAALAVCEAHGHDSPRGLCLRCGLGVDLTAERGDAKRDRAAERAEWLRDRR